MVAAFLLALASPVPSAASTPSTPPLTAVKACANAAPSTYADVFGAKLEDRALLRFVRIVESTDGKQRAAAIASARIPLAADATSSIAAALAPIPCSGSIAGNASARMAIAISQNWNISNDADADRLTARVQAVAGALLARRALDAAMVDALVAPFGTTLHSLDAPPAALAAPCAPQTDARAVRVTQPDYPFTARLARVMGKIQVKVELDDDGDVTRVALYRDNLPDSVGSNALRESSIFAAGTTLYAPGTKGCKSVSGAYIFAADFTGP